MRRRITLIAAAIVAVVLVVVGIAAVAAVRRELYENLDRSLDQRAAQVEAAFVSDASVPIVTSDVEDHFAQIVDAGGTVLASTPNATEVAVDARLLDEHGALVTVSELPIEDDFFRVLIRPVPLDGEPAFVIVGENIDDLRDTIRALVIALIVAVPLATIVLAIAVWWLVGRTLRPVESIVREVDAIGLDDLSRRVPTPDTADEIERLADTMNRMLERLETSAERQRRFVADASHELRTPLTRLRTVIEVDLGHPDADLDATLRSALEDTIDMQQLVDDLLFLARRDAVARRDTHAPVELDELVLDEIRALGEVDGVAIDVSDVSAVTLRGDASHLRRLVRNLLSNAVRHAATRVEVGLVDDGRTTTLTVADDGPGIPPEERERVFERFVRLDESRGGRLGGTGLGLSIVREIVAEHAGEIEVDERPGGGARFVVRLPLP